ncbi:D-3-phosphoglycerate dehydrogenase [Mycobacterium avium subsp. paratuberculosis]|nr:D-3-phosphoglycerate dehydrogenase [Mycobacterium avium subsp. paratuberculosis]
MNLPVVLIADKLAESTVAALGDQVEVRWVDGPDREKLLAAVPEADALLVRSATTVDAEVLAAAPKLKIVARAGVGLDNVDVDAATERGVLVVNAPTSNIHSAAEHALALLLAAAREIPAADASLREHTWKRSSFSGTEIFGKTVGVVGLGRIGQLVAQRLSAFGTHLIAYDPYVSPARAAQLGIELLSLDELLARADFISVHLPKTPETAGLIDKDALAKTKPGVIIVNAARGGLVDEAALADAVRSGHVRAAGLDVFSKEPCTDSPLFELPQVVVTPHLGASTTEAQDRAGTDVAASVKLALAGEFVPDAVNVAGGHGERGGGALAGPGADVGAGAGAGDGAGAGAGGGLGASATGTSVGAGTNGGTGMACSPAKPVKPAKPPTRVGTTNGTTETVSSGRIAGISTIICSSNVLINAMVSVMTVPITSMVVNSRVHAMVAGLPDANAAARSAATKLNICAK